MIPLVQNVTIFISLGVVVADIALVLFVFLVIFARKTEFARTIFSMISRWGVELGFLVTLSAVLTSLFYSTVAGFLPCDLCWWQRVFIFPQLVLFAAALVQKYRQQAYASVFGYSALLSLIGGLIALYHTYGQTFATSILPCNAAAVSCSKIYFMVFGYVSIPVMSLTGFLLLFVIVVSRKLAH